MPALKSEQQLTQKETEFQYIADCKSDFVNAAGWTSTQRIGSIIWDFLSTGPQPLSVDFLVTESGYSVHTCYGSMKYYERYGRIRKLDSGEYVLSGYTEQKTESDKPQLGGPISQPTLFDNLN